MNLVYAFSPLTWSTSKNNFTYCLLKSPVISRIDVSILRPINISGSLAGLVPKLASLKSEFDLKAQALQEDSQKKQREAEVQLGRIVQEAIDRIAKERGIDLVVRGETVVYATDAVNISKEVIERASKLKPVKK